MRGSGVFGVKQKEKVIEAVQVNETRQKPKTIDSEASVKKENSPAKSREDFKENIASNETGGYCVLGSVMQVIYKVVFVRDQIL